MHPGIGGGIPMATEETVMVEGKVLIDWSRNKGWHGQTCWPMECRMVGPDRISTVKQGWRRHPA